MFGLPGLFVNKAVNTADSMIGHKSSKYIQFGYASARLDDLLNLVPSRMAGIFIAIAAPAFGGTIGKSLDVMRSDAPGHVSPNAGWPEAAMAGALNVALGGPRLYDDKMVDGVWINGEGNRYPDRSYINRSIRLLDTAWLIVLALLAVAYFFARWL